MLAVDLAERIHAFDPSGAPPAALAWARTAVLDTVGVALGGAAEEVSRVLRRTGTGAGAGPHAVIGTPIRTTPVDAAFLNGVASHALDFDDGCGTMGGHPSAPVVGPLLALAETSGASGRDLLLAHIVGFEIQVRMARGVHFHHYEKGWHATATLGPFGAVAACARLLGLSRDTTATALAIAASLSSGIKANFGTMTKPLQVGNAARNGLLAVLLAQEGVTANPSALDAKQGWLNVFNGPGTFDVSRILDHWGEPWEVLNETVGLKPFACCGSLHPAIFTMLDLVETHDLRPDAVERIDVALHPRRLAHLDNPAPRDGLAAKYSLQYVMDRAVTDRAITLAHFEGDAPHDPSVARLLAVTHAAGRDDIPDGGLEISVRTRDGETVTARADSPLHFRRGPGGTPMTDTELRRKFTDCAARALPAPQVEELFATLQRLDRLPDVAALSDLLLAPSAPAEARRLDVVRA